MRDFMGIMKKAQDIQAKLAHVQNELETLEVSGQSGAHQVQIIMTAKGIVKKVTLDESLIKADEKDILEDLIAAAMNDAKRKADEVQKKHMEEVTKGLPIPSGLNLF